MSKALDEEVKADAKVHGRQKECAAQQTEEVWVVGSAHAVVKPHAVMVKILCASVAHSAVLAAGSDIHLQVKSSVQRKANTMWTVDSSGCKASPY